MKPEDENKEPAGSEEKAGFKFTPAQQPEGGARRADETRPGTTPPPQRRQGLRPVVLTARSTTKASARNQGADGTAAPEDTRPGGRPRRSIPPDLREERRACSFPGLLKVIFPESSFLPIPIAVRVANLSVQGAMIEVHDRSKLTPNATIANRFFELKVAHAALPTLRGTVAWTDFSRTNPQFGLAFTEPCPEVEDLLSSSMGGSDSAEGTGASQGGPPPLPAPRLDSFPGVALDTRIVISGSAPEAAEVRVRGEDRLFKGTVEDGRFSVTLELEPGGKNFFYLRSVAGERRSRSVPLRITCEKEAGVHRNLFEVESTEGKDGQGILRLKFHGTPADAERVLYRFSQLMGQADRLELNAMLETPGTFDEALLRALEEEGGSEIE